MSTVDISGLSMPVIAVTAGDILQKEKAPVMEPIQEVGYLPKEFDESGLGNNHTHDQTSD